MRARRRTQGALVCGAIAMVAMVGGALSPASSSPVSARERPAKAGVVTFPVQGEALIGGELARVGHVVYFASRTTEGNTRLGRITPKGTVRTSVVGGLSYSFNPPTRTTDGGIWLVTQPRGAGENQGIALAGLDPQSWEVARSPSSVQPMAFWESTADQNGRFWAQGNVPGKGIAAVGAGLGTKPVVVKTNLGPISSGIDPAVNNPMTTDKQGHVWMMGGNKFGVGLRITSVGPNGIRADLTPKGLRVAMLALARGGGRVWTVGGRADNGRLVAVGVDPGGAVTRVRTDLFQECLTDSVQPVSDGNGGLWFTGTDTNCAGNSALLLSRVRMKHGVSVTHDTGLGVLGDAVSTVLPVRKGVLVAGITDQRNLAFARVSAAGSRTVPVHLEAWVDDQQARYPIVGDGANGAWAQGVNANGKLVVVHVEGMTVTKAKTGLAPVAREISVGPDGSLWTQGLHQGKLVIVKVDDDGAVTTFPTGLQPTQLVMGPAADGKGHLWFQAVKASTGTLVLARVPAKG